LLAEEGGRLHRDILVARACFGSQQVPPARELGRDILQVHPLSVPLSVFLHSGFFPILRDRQFFTQITTKAGVLNLIGGLFDFRVIGLDLLLDQGIGANLLHFILPPGTCVSIRTEGTLCTPQSAKNCGLLETNETFRDTAGTSIE
jgi:hypothetical protein